MARRNLTQLWDAVQDNGFRTTIDIDEVRQDGTFDLEASHSNGTVRSERAFGALRRDAIGEKIEFTIVWKNQTQGEYIGRFDAQNFAFGSTFDAKNPGSKANWRSSIAFPP